MAGAIYFGAAAPAPAVPAGAGLVPFGAREWMRVLNFQPLGVFT